MKVLFLDESGDHNLSIIDPHYPLFVLGGVIVDEDYARGAVAESLDALKKDMFGNTDVILHTADIARNRNGFERLKDKGFRAAFLQRLNVLMSELEYSVVACAIRKNEHLAKFGLAAVDPYLLSLDIVIERFCFEMGKSPAGGVVVAERRGATLDREIELAWLNLKIQGTRHLQASDISERIAGFNLRSKRDNIAGLQLADLVVSPIGRHLLGKPDKRDWTIVESKLRRDQRGRPEGYGLVVLPNERGQPPLRSDQPTP